MHWDLFDPTTGYGHSDIEELLARGGDIESLVSLTRHRDLPFDGARMRREDLRVLFPLDK